MWQQIIAGVLVVAAALYAARSLGPRRWRRKPRSTGKGSGAPCGCGKDQDGCH
jgi:hypothetical protein